MSRTATLVGYGVLLAAAITLEIVARRTARVAILSDAIAALTRRRVVRASVLAAWLWVGWHLFVRVHR